MASWAILVWGLVLLAVPIAVAVSPAGWDLAVYRRAAVAVHRGQDPWLGPIAEQKQFYSQNPRPAGDPPFDYVYSPMTVPLLRLVAVLPVWLTGAIYWSAYVAGVFAEIWMGLLLLDDFEWRYFIYLAPISIFFPGLLANGIVLSGNVAYVLYGLILAAAIRGWKRGRWGWFYFAVLLAACFKAPFLSMLVIPALSASREWVRASIVAAGGVVLFALPALISPVLFRHYLEAIGAEFSYNHDFGCSLTGLFCEYLHDHGLSYTKAGIGFYFVYAVPIFAVLVYLSRRYFCGSLSLRQWAPFLLVGVILLNPRIIEYDLGAATLCLALILWRLLARITAGPRTALALAMVVLVMNVLATQSWSISKLTEGSLLVLCFTAGCWDLVVQAEGVDDAAQPESLALVRG